MNNQLFNPFELYRAEKLTSLPQFISDFSAQPLLQPDIQRIYLEKNIILLGHPGSGKSMILRSLDYESFQNLLNTNEPRFEDIQTFLKGITIKKELIGIYFSFQDEFNASSFSDFSTNNIDNNDEIFLTYLSLFLIRKFIGFLASINLEGIFKEKFSANILIQPEFHEIITEKDSELPIKDISKIVSENLNKIAKFKRSLIYNKDILTNLFIKKEEFFSIIIKGIINKLNPIRPLRILFVIDDMQEVPMNFLYVIYNLMKKQYSNIEFKIGTRPSPAYTTDLDRRDLEIIDLEVSHAQNSQNYSKFAKEVANIRLSQVPFYAQNSPDYSSIIAELSVEDEIKLMRNSDKAFSEFHEEYLESMKRLPVKEETKNIFLNEIANLSSKFEKLIYEAMVLRKLNKKNKISINEIKDYATKKLEDTDLKKFVLICLAHKLKTNIVYNSENTIIKLSSYIIKDFIEINFRLFEELNWKIFKDGIKEKNVKLTPQMQDKVIRTLSKEFIEKISKTMENGLYFHKLLNEFIDKNQDQFKLPFSYVQGRTGIGIIIDEYEKFDNDKTIINARANGFLLKFERTKGKYSSGKPIKKIIFYFHRLLLVEFNYHYIFGGYRTYHVNRILSILKGEKSSLKSIKEQQQTLLEFVSEVKNV